MNASTDYKVFEEHLNAYYGAPVSPVKPKSRQQMSSERIKRTMSGEKSKTFRRTRIEQPDI
jgi:hypothetical protein